MGIDPWCVSVETARRWEQAFLKKDQKLFQLSSNLVDEVWKDRPSADILPVTTHPLEFSGCTVEEKLKDLRKKLDVEKAYAIIITALDEVWIPMPLYSFVFLISLIILFLSMITDSLC